MERRKEIRTDLANITKPDLPRPIPVLGISGINRERNRKKYRDFLYKIISFSYLFPFLFKISCLKRIRSEKK